MTKASLVKMVKTQPPNQIGHVGAALLAAVAKEEAKS